MRIVVAMSGGVDSSVAAALLAEQGHDVIGVSMQLYDQAQTNAAGQRAFGTCCTIDDLYDARRVAAAIGIPHYIMNFESQFGEHVVSNFVREYVAGRTPIPCSHCNSDLKFATLLDRALGLGAAQLATGHYARIDRDAAGGWHLHRGADTSQGPDLLPVLADAGPAGARRVPGGPPGQGRRCAPTRTACSCAWRASPTARRSASCPDGDYAAFVERAGAGGHAARGRGERGRPRAGHARRRASLHRRPAQGAGPLFHRTPLRRRHRGRRRRRSSWARARRWAPRTLTASKVNWVSGKPESALARAHGADPPPPRRRPRARARAGGGSGGGGIRRAPRPPSPRGRRWCSTTVTK